jgi:hypothetical protein
VALDGRSFIGRQYLPGQPFAPADPDEIAVRTMWVRCAWSVDWIRFFSLDR